MALPFHSVMRQKIKNVLDVFIHAIFQKKQTHTQIPVDEIKKILVIRVNYRIGNILFTTTLLRALEKQFPNALIDVLIGSRAPKVLLEGSTHIEKIYDFPRALLKNPFKLFSYLSVIRSKKYDLIVNLNSGSTSDRLLTFLSRGTYKLGFENEKKWSPSTHVVSVPKISLHEAIKPLYLLNIFGAEANDFDHKLSIVFTKEEEQNGVNLVKEKLKTQNLNLTENSKIIGIFRDARYEKKIDNDWWKAFYVCLKELDPDLVVVDILSVDVPEKLDESIYYFKESNLRTLSILLKNIDVFVSGDTGPMHLASASGVPTVGLFKTSSPSLYGTLGNNDLSVAIASETPQKVAKIIVDHLSRLKEI